MHIDGAFDTLGNPALNGVSFSAVLICKQVDEVNRIVIGCPGGGSTRIQAGAPVPFFANTPLAFPYDLTYTFNTDATHNEFQFVFNISGSANGSADLSAAHTALISFDLAPGVTVDQSSGFLTTPGDITRHGDGPVLSSVPESSALKPVGLGLVALISRRICIAGKLA